MDLSEDDPQIEKALKDAKETSEEYQELLQHVLE